MATRKMYRSLMIDRGKIELKDMDIYSGQIVLEEVDVEFDDTIREEHRDMLINAIEKNITEKQEKFRAEMFKLEQLRDSLLQIEHKPSREGEPVEGEVMPRHDFDEPF